MSAETKTSKEILNALIAAGIKCCDVVKLNNGEIGTVTVAEECGARIETKNESLCFSENFVFYSEVWPTHFCRPMFSQETDTFVLERFYSAYGESTTATISYEPAPLTLEERVERLEKLQGAK